MSTVSTIRPPTPPSDDPDPYRYGWRYVRVTGPDGLEEFDQVPLTLEDVLHPEVGDFIVQTNAHDRDRAYFRSVSEVRLERDRTKVVLSDCRVDYNIPGVQPLGPDIAVFSRVSRYIDWATFDVAEEGARPELVVEITSPSTRDNDVGIKLIYYHRADVPWYIIADVVEEDEDHRRIELIAYRHEPGGYRRVAADHRGWIWVETIGLWLGVVPDSRGGYSRLACFEPETGQEVGDYSAVTRQLEAQIEARMAAEARAYAESEARAQAEQRATAESEARAQAEQRATAESEARAQAEQRAVAEGERVAIESQARAHAEARAQAEFEARAQAEARIRELEALLKDRGPSS